MRLTINLDEDLYAMARNHAIATKTSLSKAVGDLLRRRAGGSGAGSPTVTACLRKHGTHPLSGFPVSDGDKHQLTEAEIRRAIDDDLVRPLEIMGVQAKEIEGLLR
jgi:hypothetical protein